ncbi:uncharacterized protein LOC133778333 isoform X1 [Humulus lupulus]|uniref:uncharacterized protein LOC133778333 isoform X1 n=2 Tax=Humulus lupulus TaxID=3486 RepID=UPI002B405277|nr:uncharacterized protein LOC133778333 isoform X1 [Humulus lupulus]
MEICFEVEMKNSNRQFAKSKKLEYSDREEDIESSLSSSSSEDEEEIERELADVTFEELQKARSNGSHSVPAKDRKEKKVGRANKNRPMEVSCKKPVGRFRDVVQAPKKVVRDPRFESLCGTLDNDGFKKRYNFLYEEELPAEKEELRKQLKKSRDPEVIEELKNQLSWINKQLKPDSTKHRENAILAEHKRKEREAVKQGKKPFYLKKSDVRKQRLLEKYEQLQGSGKLEAYIEKRRKKNAAKDQRYMPYRKPVDNQQQQSK